MNRAISQSHICQVYVFQLWFFTSAPPGLPQAPSMGKFAVSSDDMGLMSEGSLAGGKVSPPPEFPTMHLGSTHCWEVKHWKPEGKGNERREKKKRVG